LQNSKTAKPQNRITAKQQNSKTAKQQNSITKELYQYLYFNQKYKQL